MSWEDKVNKLLTITCGDGKQFTVVWMNASKSIDWNGSEFQFLEIDGTYAKQKKLLGRKFPLEFYFQGPDHLDEFSSFEKSCGDIRPCVISHPLYGLIIAKIFSMSVDNTTMNYSKVNCIAIETITDANPSSSLDPIDTIAKFTDSLAELSAAELQGTPSITDVNSLTLTNAKNYKQGIKIITIPDEAELYFNAFNQAASAVNTAIASPLLAMQATISLLTLPAKFTADVKSRISNLTTQFENLRLTLTNMVLVPSKQIYEVQGNSLIGAMCLAASTPLSGNYRNSNSAIAIVETLLANYRTFLQDLDTLQDPNGGNPGFFIPGFNALSQLNELVNLTVSSLIRIALNGRQERSLILTDDTNLILLTHRLYSLDPLDNNMLELIDNNNFVYSDMLALRKGRKIIYYI